MSTRYVVEYDLDFQLEECDGGPLPCSPEVYAANPYMKDGAEVSYADYLKYWGDPSRHVVYIITRQNKCPCCASWVAGDSLGGIDLMDDSPEALLGPGTYTLEQLPGYLAECARELTSDKVAP